MNDDLAGVVDGDGDGDAFFSSPAGAFTEHDAATLIRKTLLAIEHCHNEHDIVHRDLKPENFLFKTKDEDSGASRSLCMRFTLF